MTKNLTITLILLLTLLYMGNAHSGTIAYLTRLGKRLPKNRGTD